MDDLRHADALIHVVDVSGTTDAEGKIWSEGNSGRTEMLKIIPVRKGYERIRSLTRHNMATVRDSEMDRRQFDGEMVTLEAANSLARS